METILHTCINTSGGLVQGAVHKVRQARGGGGPRRCDSVWQGGGGRKEHLYMFFYHTYETWNLKWSLTFCCKRCILTDGGMDKNLPGQNLPDKRPPDKPPGQKFVQWAFVRAFCTRPTKNRVGGPRCVTYFRGSRDVWQSVTGGVGSKLAKNSVTYFIDGPYINACNDNESINHLGCHCHRLVIILSAVFASLSLSQ